jgi:hypothetical protein
VAPVKEPVACVRPLQQYAVRTPSPEREGGYSYAIVCTSRTDLSMTGVVEDYDKRAGMEADLKADKHGLGQTCIRKRRLPAQTLVVLLTGLAHHVLIWARQWLGEHAPRLREYGIVRLIQQVWAIPGRVKLTEEGLHTSQGAGCVQGPPPPACQQAHPARFELRLNRGCFGPKLGS